MPMPPYPVLCYTARCDRLAVYKIAARWSDGVTGELKTYCLTCEECLAESFRRSRRKQAACRTAPGETLELPGIYVLTRGQRDRQLERRTDLEQQLLSGDLADKTGERPRRYGQPGFGPSAAVASPRSLDPGKK